MVATNVRYVTSILDNGATLHWFQNMDGGADLMVEKYENGIAYVVPSYITPIVSMVRVVEGCFSDGSNFNEELKKAFKVNNDFTQIDFCFNDVVVSVTKENADARKLYEEYMVKRELQGIDPNLPGYEECKDYALKKMRIMEAKNKEAISVAESTTLIFKDENAKKRWEELVWINSTDKLMLAITTVAKRWGKYMQYLMETENRSVMEIADEAFFACNFCEPIYYPLAVAMLAETWVHGKELREWHNAQWDYREDGVYNPMGPAIKIP